MNTTVKRRNAGNLKAKTKCIAVMLLICIILPLFCVGCQSTVDGISVKDATAKKILKLISEQDFAEADSVYNNGRVKDKTAEALSDALPNMLEDFINKYKTGEKDYSTCVKFCKLLQDWIEDGLDMDKNLIQDALSTLEKLESSKELYKAGVKLYNDSNWLEAIKSFASVSSDDSNYSDAVAKYADCFEKINVSIDQLVSAGNFEQAKEMVNDVLMFFQQYMDAESMNDAYNHDTYQNKYDEIVAAEKASENAVIRDAAIDEAREEYNKGNYADAFDIIDNYTDEYGSDDVIESTRNEFQNNYVTMIVQKSTEAIEAKEYLRALDMLRNAMSVVSDDRLNAKLDELNAVKPTYLCELSCAQSEQFEQAQAGETYTDVLGNTYDYRYGNLFKLWSDCWWDAGNAAYCLNYNYDKFSCTITIDNQSDNFDETDFQIIGDGVVIYSVKVSRKFSPTLIELDVSNINWLEFRLAKPGDGKGIVLIDGAQLTK